MLNHSGTRTSPTESGSSVSTRWRLTKQLIPCVPPPAALDSERWQRVPGTGSRGGGGGSRGARAQHEAIVPNTKTAFQVGKWLRKKKQKKKTHTHTSLPQTFYKPLLPALLSAASTGAAWPKQALASKSATWSPELLLRRAERSDVMIINFFTWAPDGSVCQCLLRLTTAEPPSGMAV